MENKRTCLYDRHVALGALISPFGGFDMPIQYSSIVDEHQAVRNHCGVFDVSHMGEVVVTGPDAEKYVNHIFTNDIKDAPLHKIFYGMMLYPDGGTVDDLLVYKMGDNNFFIVINAANIDKDVAWMLQNAEGFDVVIDNQSEYYGHAQNSLSIPPRLSTSMAKPSSSAAQAILAKMASKSMAHINSSRLNGISSWRADVASLADSAAATLFASRLVCLSMATNFQPTFLLSWQVSASSANSTKRSS